MEKCPFKYKGEKPKEVYSIVALKDAKNWVQYDACKIMNTTICIGENKCPIMKK